MSKQEQELRFQRPLRKKQSYVIASLLLVLYSVICLSLCSTSSVFVKAQEAINQQQEDDQIQQQQQQQQQQQATEEETIIIPDDELSTLISLGNELESVMNNAKKSIQEYEEFVQTKNLKAQQQNLTSLVLTTTEEDKQKYHGHDILVLKKEVEQLFNSIENETREIDTIIRNINALQIENVLIKNLKSLQSKLVFRKSRQQQINEYYNTVTTEYHNQYNRIIKEIEDRNFMTKEKFDEKTKFLNEAAEDKYFDVHDTSNTTVYFRQLMELGEKELESWILSTLENETKVIYEEQVNALLKKELEKQQKNAVTDDSEQKKDKKEEIYNLYKKLYKKLKKQKVKQLLRENKQTKLSVLFEKQQQLLAIEQQQRLELEKNDIGNNGLRSIDNSNQCVKPLDVVQEIQTSLLTYSQDGIGLYDHVVIADNNNNDDGTKLSTTSSIVHSLTSATYVPPPDPKDLIKNSWWRKYIPEDWEQHLLPRGFENWSVRIPEYIYHTLGVSSSTSNNVVSRGVGGGSLSSTTAIAASSILSLLSSILRGTKGDLYYGGGGPYTAPPETILNPNIHPGSCWPMEGSHGKVTILLPYPMRLDGITIDHVSSTIVKQQYRSSAPKQIFIKGYRSHGSRRNGKDFDPKDNPIPIMKFEYNRYGPSIQTFLINDAISSANSNNDTNIKQKDIDPDTIGCSSDADETLTSDSTSCDASSILEALADDEEGVDEYVDEDDGSTIILYDAAKEENGAILRAIQIQVLNNWGNSDYTCLYRVRVHGEAI